MTGSRVFDHRPCQLGEGPFWHPIREHLFWFDITGNRLLTQTSAGPEEWRFAENVSAAGWVSRDVLLIASETALLTFDLTTGVREVVCPLEATNPITRSNDGRADPQGGFWIGTMGKKAEAGAGAIYRYYRGELRRLFAPITISNAICFAPSGRTAYFTDTDTRQILAVALDAQGWPVGAPTVHVDTVAEGLRPDGAVVDLQGNLWVAQWGAARVSAYDPQGRYLTHVGFESPHTSCPTFGGAEMSTLFCTTALQGMTEEARARYPDAGKVFTAPTLFRGQYEHQVIL